MEPVQQSVQQPVSNNRALYDNLINSKRVTADQIGDFDTFNNMLSDPSNATALHDNLIKQGGFKEEEIGSQYDFMKNIDPIQAPSQPLETPSAKQPFSSVDPAVHNIAQADSIDAVNRGITPQMEMQEPRPDTTDWNYRPDDKSSQISFTEHPLDATGQWMKDLWGSGKQATQEASNLIQKGTQEVAGYANELANWMDDSPTKKSTAENQKVDEHIKANLDNLNTEKATIQQYTPMYKSAGYVGGAAPYAALAATSLLTGSGEVAVASKLGFALLGVGTGADAYEKHVENTGESENKGTKALTELLYGTLYAGPIPAVVGKYMPKSWIGTILGKEVLNPEVQNTAGKIAFETFAKDQPTLAGRYISTLVKDAPASVASMETMMVGSKAVDQFVIGDDVKAKDYWETAKGAALTGIAFHAVIGAFATGKAGPDMIKRWDSQGSVGITLDAKGRSVEVLPSVEGKPQKGMRPDGTIVDVTPEMAKNTFIVPTELLKSELGKFKQTGSTSPTIERDAYLGNVSNFLNKITNTDGLIYSTIDQSGKEQFGIGKDSQGNTLLVDRSGNQSTMQSAPQWTTTDPKVLFKQFEDGYKPNSQRIGEAQPGQPTAPVQPVDPRTQAQQQAATFYDQHKDQDSGLLRTIGQTTPDGENTKCWFITKEVDGGEGNQFYIVEDGEGNHESISKSQVTGEIQEIGQEDFINSKLGAYDQNQQLQQQAQQNQLTYQGQVLDRIDNPEAKTKKYETFTDKDGGFVNVPNEIVAAWEKSKQQDPNANPNIVTQSYGKTQVTGEKDAQGNLAVSDPMTVDQTENLKAEVERTTGGKATVKAAEIPNNDPTQQGSYQVSIVPNVVPVVTSSQPVTQPVAERKIITQKFGNTELDIVEGDGYDEVVPSEKMPLEKALPVLEKKFKDHPKFKLQVDKSQVEIPAETKYDDPTYKTVIKSIRIIPKNANNSKPKNENVDQNNGENAVNQQSLTTDSSQNLQENEQTNEKGLQNVSQAEQPNVGNSTGETGITENTNGETYISRTSDELAPPPADQMPVGEISIPTTRKIRAVQNEDTAQPTSDVPSDTNSPDTEVATVQNIEPLTPESNEQHTKGVNNVFIQNPELVNIGTPKEYSEYLNGIFPDSRLKDVVYHIGWVKNEFDKNKIGTGEGSLVLGRGFYFGTDDLTSIATQVGFEEVVREANGDQNEIIKGLGDHLKIGVLDIQNPYYEKGDLRWGNVSGNEQLIRDVTKLNDGIISDGEYIVFEPDQIHILGSEKDIEGFKKYKLNGTEPTNLTPSNDRGNGTPLAEQGNSDKVSSSDQSATELSPNSSNTGVEKGAEKTKGINGIITNFNQNVKKQRNGRKPRSTKVIESEVENAEQLSETASTETEIAEAEQVIIDLTAEIDDAIEIIDLGFTKEKRINENTLNSVGVLGESSFIESGIDKYVSEKGLDKQEFEDSDEYNSKFNELSDSYPDYIKELANSGQLQTIYDNSNLGQQIEISKTIQLAGFEVKDLIDLSKVRNEAKSKKEVEKQEKLDKLHEAIGISKSLPLSEVLSNAKKAVEEKKAESKIANDTNLLSDVKVKQEDNPVTEKQPLKPLEDVLKEAKEKVEGNKSGNNILNEPEATYGKKKPVGFYSTVEKALTRIQQEKGTTDQFKAMLLKNGAKQAELDWMGFDEQFKDKKSLTKQEVQEWIDQNRIDVKEITKSYKWNGKFENTITDEDGNTSVVKFSPYNKPLLDFLKEAKEKVSEKKVDNSVNSDNFTANENQKTYQTEAGETIPYRTFSSINDGANSGDIQRQADRSSNPSLRGLNKGERSSVEMKYTADKNFMFSGKNKIESTDDVAYLFRQLENKSVENMFACLVKDGKPVIIHLSMGTSSSTLMNYGVLNDAITRFSPDKVYLIHNHPSGSLEPSQADISIHQQAVGAYGDMMGEHIIINLKTGKYARFRMGEGDHLILNRPTSEKTPSNYKVIKFDKQVFKQDAILPMQVSESGEVAQFLSQQRFTKGVKLSAVILDRGMQIKAYLHLSASDFTTGEGVRQLAKELQAYAGRFGGQNVILFGQKVDLNNTQSVNGLTALKATLKKSEIALQDYLSIGKVVTFDSMFDNGLLQEPQGSFGNSEVHDSHVPLEDFLKNAKAKVLENRKSKPKLKDFATEDDYNKAVKAWSKAKEVLTPEEHKAILTNLGNNVGDKSISEIGKQAEDEWLGNRDVESTKANLEATRQQEEIKKSFHRGGVAKTWQEIDKAITHYIEHGSDINSDEKTSYDHLTNYDKHIIDVARNLTPDQIKIANEIKSQNDAIGLKSFQAGQIDNVIENHVNHIWNREGKLTPSDYFTNFSQKTGHAKKRVFPKITDGLKAGFTQKVEGATNSLMIKKIEMNNAIEGRKLVDKGLKTFGNDGMPLFTTKAGVPGYKKIDHYNFTKWRKVKKVKNVSGKPLKDENVMIGKEGKVMVKKAIFAPAEIADRLNTILGNGIKWGPFKVMQQFNGAVKQTVLSFSFFHPLNFMKNYYLTEHVKNLSDLNMVGSYKKGLKMAKEFGPLAEKLVRGGMTVGKTQEWDELNEVSASKLGKKLSLLPYAGPVKDAIVNLHKAQNDWIFKQMGVGLKFKQGISELQRQIKLNPNTDPDILAKNVGELMNNLYGGINRDRKHRSKITQGIFSLLTFAPDWTETNFSNFFKATHFDFSDATTGDKVTKIDKMAEWFRSGFKGVNPDEHKMYMKMWGGLMLRAAVITTAMNLAMALFNDPDHEEEYWQTVKRMFKDSFSNPLRLNWLAPNITPVHNAFVGTDDKQHYFNVLGPFMDAVKMVAEPISFLKNKSSVLARLTLNALTGSNWQGKSYTTASELAGTDDKGMYATSNKKTGVKAGDLKGGRHEGQLTKYAAPGEEKVLSWSQMPSFGLETLRSMFPIGVQGAMEYGEGEKDGWQTLTTGLGLKMASAKEPTTDYPKIAKGITTKADIYIGVIKDAMRTNDKVLADKLQNDPLYKTVQDIYGQGKAINRIKKAIELYKEMGNTSEADHYQKQLDDLYKEVAEKYSEINFPDKYR
jgi:hypothetical protein